MPSEVKDRDFSLPDPGLPLRCASRGSPERGVPSGTLQVGNLAVEAMLAEKQAL